MEIILCADEATCYLWRKKDSGNYEEELSAEEFIELSSLETLRVVSPGHS